MKNKALYEKTVSILVDAYMNDTLQHGDCGKCAVGNLCAAYGFPPMRIGVDVPDREAWSMLFYTGLKGQYVDKTALSDPNVMTVIRATGYHWEELAQIEKAFELAPEGKSDDEWMWNGLMAVIDVLDKIHGNVDPVVNETSKKRFVRV